MLVRNLNASLPTRTQETWGEGPDYFFQVPLTFKKMLLEDPSGLSLTRCIFLQLLHRNTFGLSRNN